MFDYSHLIRLVLVGQGKAFKSAESANLDSTAVLVSAFYYSCITGVLVRLRSAAMTGFLDKFCIGK